MEGRPGTLTEIVVGDEPSAWAAVGFAVDSEGTTRIGTVRVRLVGADDERGRGLLAWTLAGAVVDGGNVDGLATTTAGTASDLTTTGAPAEAPPDATGHPNGVTEIDHVVAVTPDIDRTTAALEAAGVAARRTREVGPGRLQRFFRVGEPLLELIGPAEARGTGPARFYGLAFTVADIDATATHLADSIGRTKDAVQPGRRIATLHAGDGVSVPVAFMSPDPRTLARGAG
jgi:glyoxalase/bleomycin resistance protein/dioxygenase superfamily protein